MSTREEARPAGPDPYALTADEIQEPPRGWARSVRYLGPGLILSASIVGSGELIATTALGAQVGFVLFWLVVVGTLVKVAVQVELARWTVSTGQPALTGYAKVPPHLGRFSWVSLLWLALFASKVFQVGGIVGGAAVALSLLFPIGDPLGFTSILVWTVVVALSAIVLLWSNRYGLIERVAVLLVGAFSLITVVIVLGLPFTDFGYDGGDLLSGLTLQIPAGAVGAAVAMFGLIGVSVDEISEYPYWCIEKGYARWVGPKDGSEAWVRRADGWLKVMYKDAFLSWIVYTFSTLAFYIMGAAVLHPQGLRPEGNEMILTLSRMYTDTLGEWASVVFLVGAFAVLGSTLWAGLPGWTRMSVDFLATAGVLDWNDRRARERWFRVFTVALPVVWAIAYLVIQVPLLMVQIGGVMSGIFLVVVVVAVWYLRRTETDPRLYGGRLFRVMLVVSSLAIGALGVYTMVDAVT